MELDELNAGMPDIVTADPEDAQPDVITEEITKEEKPEVNIGDITPSTEETPETPATGDKVETSDLTGIEQYLSKFDIEGGMISFEDGTKTHFTEMEPDKQVEILSQLHDSSSADIEDKYGLDESEIGIINYLRENDTTIDEVIDKMASQRAQTYIMSQQVQEMDVAKMDDDSIYTSFLLKSNPEATADQLEKDLAKAKEMSNYNAIVTNIRSTVSKEREDFISKKEQEDYQVMSNEIEDQRKQVVDTVTSLKDIDGLSLDDNIKNDVLDLILNVDDDGDSLFMTKVFSDPKELFKAAFWYKNGADITTAREDYWKKEKSAAYKRGLEDSKYGRKTFSSTDAHENKTTPHYGDMSELSSLDELYNI